MMSSITIRISDVIAQGGNIDTFFGEIQAQSYICDEIIGLIDVDATLIPSRGLYVGASSHVKRIVLKGNTKETTILQINSSICYGDVDDCIIGIKGANNRFIDVEIGDLSIVTDIIPSDIPSGDVPKIIRYESYLVKIYRAKRIHIHDVCIHAENIPTTCLNIRKAHNIHIHDSEFINYNRCSTGGGIWLEGDIIHARIHHNVVRKYGNDEALAMWCVNNLDGCNEDLAYAVKRDVQICFNQFYNEKLIESDAWTGVNDVFLKIYTDQTANKRIINDKIVDNPVPTFHTVEGLLIANNEFRMNAKVSHVIELAFDKYSTVKDIAVSRNTITYGGNWVEVGREIIDFDINYDYVYDSTSGQDTYCDEPIRVVGNSVTCGRRVYSTYDGIVDWKHLCLNIRGVKVLFADNIITGEQGEYSSTEADLAHQGIRLLSSYHKGGEIVMVNNHCTGLQKLGDFRSRLSGVPTKVKLTALGNYLKWDLRINTETDVVEADYTLRDNRMESDYPILCLKYFAVSGSLIFDGNNVRIVHDRVPSSGNDRGYLYHGSTGGSVQSMKVVCSGNIFNFPLTNSMYGALPAVAQLVHKNNCFSDIIE